MTADIFYKRQYLLLKADMRIAIEMLDEVCNKPEIADECFCINEIKCFKCRVKAFKRNVLINNNEKLGDSNGYQPNKSNC